MEAAVGRILLDAEKFLEDVKTYNNEAVASAAEIGVEDSPFIASGKMKERIREYNKLVATGVRDLHDVCVKLDGLLIESGSAPNKSHKMGIDLAMNLFSFLGAMVDLDDIPINCVDGRLVVSADNLANCAEKVGHLCFLTVASFCIVFLRS